MVKSKAKRADPAQKPTNHVESSQKPQKDDMRNDIRKDMRMEFSFKGSIDREDIIARYNKLFPERLDRIRDIVHGYVASLNDHREDTTDTSPCFQLCISPRGHISQKG